MSGMVYECEYDCVCMSMSMSMSSMNMSMSMSMSMVMYDDMSVMMIWYEQYDTVVMMMLYVYDCFHDDDSV